MQRELWTMEEWIYSSARREYNPLPINFGMAVECTQPFSEQELRRALDGIPEFLPLSRARVVLRAPQRALVTTEGVKTIPLFFKQVANCWEEMAREVASPFDDPYAPLVRLFAYDTPEGFFLFVHFDHALVDGIGAVVWLRSLFALLQGKIPPPPPSWDWKEFFASHYNPQWEKTYEASQQGFFERFSNWVQGFSEPLWPERLSYSLFVETLSPSETRALLEAARAHRTSVHSAIAVAFLQAFFELGINHRHPVRTVLSPVNLRKRYHVPEDFYGLLNGTLRTSVDFSQSRDFWQRCVLFKRELQLQWEITDFLYYHYRAERDLEKALQRGFKKRRRFDTRGDYDLSLTNVGVLDHPLFHPFVKRIYGPIAQGLPSETVLGVSTYNNELTFSLVSKPFFLPDDMAKRLVIVAKELLLSHC